MPDVTLGELKDYLGVTDSLRDIRLRELVFYANDFVRVRTGRDWQSISRTEMYQGNGTDSLVLRNNPVQSLTSVTVDGVAIDLTTDRVIAINLAQGILYRTDGRVFGPQDAPFAPFQGGTGVFPHSRRYLITVVYTGGALTVPHSLHGATLEIAAYLWNASGGQVSATAAGLAVRLTEKDMDKIPTVKAALDLWVDPARGYLS